MTGRGVDSHAELPNDPDLSADPTVAALQTAATRTSAAGSTRSARASQLTLGTLALVAAGGALGTAARALLGQAIPSWGGFPLALFVVNCVGALALGMLVEGLARRGTDGGGARRIQLLAGTGFLGSFTTYSALATDTVLLSRDQPGLAFAYAVGTVVVGFGCSVAGIWLAGRNR